MRKRQLPWLSAAMVLVALLVMAGCRGFLRPRRQDPPQIQVPTERKPTRPTIEVEQPDVDVVDVPPVEPEVRGVGFDVARDLQMIHFEFDKSRITPEAAAILEGNAEVIRQNPDVIIQIEGHCDERGTNDYNLALGQRRASSTREYLIRLGVESGSLTTISYGEERPEDLRHNEEAWAKNRRAKFGRQQ